MYKIGQSRDVHRLERGRKLVLGTIDIPSEFGAVAHSDGDCLVHAIVEAIIGALGLGDIGKHFPDNDPKYENINSSYFLVEVKKLLIAHNYEIINIDSTVHLEKPMLKMYVELMQKQIASFLGISESCINVKATRGEKIGYIGRSEGVEAECVVLLKSKSKIQKI